LSPAGLMAPLCSDLAASPLVCWVGATAAVGRVVNDNSGKLFLTPGLCGWNLFFGVVGVVIVVVVTGVAVAPVKFSVSLSPPFVTIERGMMDKNKGGQTRKA
jgi:hypothetical protein